MRFSLAKVFLTALTPFIFVEDMIRHMRPAWRDAVEDWHHAMFIIDRARTRRD